MFGGVTHYRQRFFRTSRIVAVSTPMAQRWSLPEVQSCIKARHSWGKNDLLVSDVSEIEAKAKCQDASADDSGSFGCR